MAPSSRLSALFPALGRAGFLNRHWPNRPAVAHGDVDRLRELVDVGGLGQLLTLAVRSRMQIKAMLHSTGGEPSEVPIQPDDVLPMCNVGATIACNELHRWHRGVFDWVEGLRSELGVPESCGQCNLYMTQSGHGVPMHFDDHEVIVVQLAGRKRWTIAQNTTVVNPLHNAGRALEGEAGRYADGAPPADLRRGRAVAMRPGSVLFLPRGYWHQTIAQERSISLTFGFKTPSWLDLLQQHLVSTLSLRPEWRQTAWHVWDDSTRRRAAGERWDALRTALVTGLAGLSLDEVVPPTPRARAQSRRRAKSTRPRR